MQLCAVRVDLAGAGLLPFVLALVSNPSGANLGLLAQLGEHLLDKQGVTGSSPVQTMCDPKAPLRRGFLHSWGLGLLPAELEVRAGGEVLEVPAAAGAAVFE